MNLLIDLSNPPTNALLASLSGGRAPNLEAVLADTPTATVQLTEGDGAFSAKSGDALYAIELAIGTPGNATPLVYLATWTATADGWTGKPDLATAELKSALTGKTDARLTLEIQLTGPEGLRKTVCQAPITIRNEVIDGTSFPNASLPEAVLKPAATPLSVDRVPYANAFGQLVDSANFLRRGSTDQLLVGPATATGTVQLDVTAASGSVVGRISAPAAADSATLAMRATADNFQISVAQRGSTASGTVFGAAAASLASIHSFSSGVSGFMLGLQAASPIMFANSGVERMRISAAGGNLQIGTTAAPPASFAKGLLLATGTAPTADPAAGTAAVWFDGSNIRLRIGATTYTLTKT